MKSALTALSTHMHTLAHRRAARGGQGPRGQPHGEAQAPDRHAVVQCKDEGAGNSGGQGHGNEA